MYCCFFIGRESLFEKKFGTQRQKIFEDIDRFINPDQALDHVVYDLDAIVKTAGPTYTGAYSNHTNRDELRYRTFLMAYAVLRWIKPSRVCLYFTTTHILPYVTFINFVIAECQEKKI